MVQERIYTYGKSHLAQHAPCSEGKLQGDFFRDGENNQGNWYCRHEPADGRAAWYHYVNRNPNDGGIQSTYYRNWDGSSSYRNVDGEYGWYEAAPDAAVPPNVDSGEEEAVKTEDQEIKLED